MRIYVFLDLYPSLYKPYFDTQLEQFLADGHEVEIFAFGCHRNEPVEAKVVALGLDRATRYLPSTLRTIPQYLLRCLFGFSSRPFARLLSLTRIFDGNRSNKENLLCLVRAVLLPIEAPDVCLVHNLTTQVRVPFLRALYPTARVAMYYHGGETAGVPEIGTESAKIAFSSADVIFTNTESSKQNAIGRGCSSEKIVISPMGFNVHEFSPCQNRSYKREGVLRLLSIGRMSEEKGFIYLLEAVRILKGEGISNIRCCLIGGGPLIDELRSYVKEQQLEAMVDLMGPLPRSRLFEELSEADVLVLPSIVLGTWAENQACVVQEAMLMKTLVATSITGGVPESIPHEMRQFSFSPGNGHAIVDRIKLLLALSPERMAEMGNRCRMYAEATYDIKLLNDRLLEQCTRSMAGRQ